jgi:hypothetical protein
MIVGRLAVLSIVRPRWWRQSRALNPSGNRRFEADWGTKISGFLGAQETSRERVNDIFSDKHYLYLEQKVTLPGSTTIPYC